MKEQFDSILSHFQKDLSTLQVGRVTPSILDDIMVEAYNAMSPLNQVASVTNQGAQQLIIQPWDKSILKDIEKALRTAGRDYNPVVDGVTVRLPFPPLTEEKRRDVVKLVAGKCEEAHVSVKRVREECMNAIKAKKTDKTISEDAAFAEQKTVQKCVDDTNATLDQLAKTKEADIMKL